ncbi:MAG: hypothetical protein H6Q02_1583, partial [Acidobacteria bacterium]|nr:hypothetical protein [Acidobacteriota bacterium]
YPKGSDFMTWNITATTGALPF